MSGGRRAAATVDTVTPLDLSKAFIDAYNRRDAEGLRRLLDPDIVYIRMGGHRAPDVDDIVSRYVAGWEEDYVFDLRRATQQGDAVVIEITGRQQIPPHGRLEAADYHRWRDGRMVEYRAYVDATAV